MRAVCMKLPSRRSRVETAALPLSNAVRLCLTVQLLTKSLRLRRHQLCTAQTKNLLKRFRGGVAEKTICVLIGKAEPYRTAKRQSR